jgi:hypothetical protein
MKDSNVHVFRICLIKSLKENTKTLSRANKSISSANLAYM